MSMRLTRRAIFERCAAGGLAAMAAGASLAGCNGKPQQETKPNPSEPKADGSGGKDMRKYVCGKCGHVYDPGASDPAKPFADLPDDWTCPKCGSPKSRFAPRA